MNANHSRGEGISLIGIIPQYPKHSQQNVYGRVRMPPVGIVSILSQIQQNARFRDVYAIDENNYRGPRDYTGMPDHGFLQQREPAKIAMFYGGMSNSIPRMFSVAQQYKKFGAITIAGGSHVDSLPEEALASGIDIVVHGEGEESTREILERIMKDGETVLDPEELAAVKGISILDEHGEYRRTPRREPIEDLDSLKDTDLTLIKFLKKRWTAIPVNRGRGCDWNCEFCVVNKQYGKYKSSSIEKAFIQVIKYSDMGYRDFFFTDDNFAQNESEAIELCKMIGDYKRKFRKKLDLIVQVRSEAAENDDLIEAMRFAGVKMLAIGYESPINEELRNMKKGVTLEKLIERSRKLSKYFYLHGMFIFGYPLFQDSRYKPTMTLAQKAREYVKFFKKAKADTVQVVNALPLPGSGLRAKLEAEGRLLPIEIVGWDKYDGSFVCYDPTPEGIDAYELQTLPRVLMKKRYLGNVVSRKVNYGNWMNWAYNATIGFPIQFGMFYTRRFIHNFIEERRGRKITGGREALLPRRNIFHESLASAWGDIERKWRNLAIKTYGGGIVRRWFKEYKKIDYRTKLRESFSIKGMSLDQALEKEKVISR